MKNTLFTNDNLFILYGLNSESVDLIYLDPPFNSKRTYSAPVGSKSAGASFKDMWTWEDVDDGYLDKLVERYPSLVRFIQSIEEIHSKGMMAYVTYMTQRLIEMHRVLKETGSIYLHCDPTASHYLKIVLDEVFGRGNFVNNINWCYNTQGKPRKGFAKKHDDILYYAKNIKLMCFNKITIEPNDIARYNKTEEETGKKYQIDGKGYKYYLEDGRYCPDYWDIPALTNNAKERTGYPTQKPLALLHRIIQASSKEGDIVLDPFCGCATTCVAAQQLNRKWIGIDIEKQAASVLIERLEKDGNMDDGLKFVQKDIDFIHRADIPQRTDIKQEPITANIKEKLFKEQKGCCNACSIELDIWHFEVDHIVPKAKGGGDYYENYQLLCGNCNRIKGDRPMEYLRTKIKSREELMKNKISFGE
jgi:DNA modification methylase